MSHLTFRLPCWVTFRCIQHGLLLLDLGDGETWFEETTTFNICHGLFCILKKFNTSDGDSLHWQRKSVRLLIIPRVTFTCLEVMLDLFPFICEGPQPAMLLLGFLGTQEVDLLSSGRTQFQGILHAHIEVLILPIFHIYHLHLIHV